MERIEYFKNTIEYREFRENSEQYCLHICNKMEDTGILFMAFLFNSSIKFAITDKNDEFISTKL